MSTITLDDVKRLAQLSALEVSDEQAESLRKHLEEIVGYFDQLNEVDVTGLEPTYQVTDLENVMRADEIKDYGTSHKDLMKNAPDTEGGHIKVKKVL